MEAAFIFSIIGYLITGYCFGISTKSLAELKGYRGYFLVGFFSLILGLLYVVGLPLSKERVLEEQKQQADLIAKALEPYIDPVD